MFVKLVFYWRHVSGFLSVGTLFFIFFSALAHASKDNGPTYRTLLEAYLIAEGEPIKSGLEWKVFRTDVNEDGRLPLLATANGGTKTFDMSAGEYYIHVAYGFAGATRRIKVRAGKNHEIFILNAGGLQLEATTYLNGQIEPELLRFDVFSEKKDDRGIRKLIAHNISPAQITLFAAGTYHIVSRYGTLNAETRADLHIEAGSLTQATLQHRAATIKFRLVNKTGGSAITDTFWSILTENGDVIKESASPFPMLILAEGNYTAVARNSDKLYSQDFQVKSGVNRVMEIRVSDYHR